MMKKKNNPAVFPGSFDPFTIGHKALVEKGLDIFDRIIIAVGFNAEKKGGLLLVDNRVELIKTVFKDFDNVEVEKYDTLTVDFCREKNASFILRGLRNIFDFNYEKSIAEINKRLAPEIQTVFVFSEPEFDAVSSSVVRELFSYKKDVSSFLPKDIDLEYFINR